MTTLNGILNINKPAGWTSHDVVAWVRRVLREKRAGHAGTLDPMATGVLLVCLGQATRVAEYLMGGEKVYRAEAQLGIVTDTYDADGEVMASAPVPPLTADDLRRTLAGFVGEIMQVPPAYSAIKQDGVAAYRKARRGEAVTLAPRPVTIRRIELLDWTPADAPAASGDRLTIEVTCGAGTYIRSLTHDLGQALGLRRSAHKPLPGAQRPIHGERRRGAGRSGRRVPGRRRVPLPAPVGVRLGQADACAGRRRAGRPADARAIHPVPDPAGRRNWLRSGRLTMSSWRS